MKTLSLYFSGWIFLFDGMCCGGSAQSNPDKNSSSASATGNSSDGAASFPCMLDGVKFSAGGTDQNINPAFRLKGTDKDKIFFKLSDIKGTVRSQTEK